MPAPPRHSLHYATVQGLTFQWIHVAGFFRSKRNETGLQLVKKQPVKERMFQTGFKGVLQSSLVMI